MSFGRARAASKPMPADPLVGSVYSAVTLTGAAGQANLFSGRWTVPNTARDRRWNDENCGLA